ncbi:MAG: TonB-dependent receptor plug domain-containing protein [Verrucomicrobiota bacterium]|nr:TonB-dependent receptor plug domain-containing protein [Verrucomicrobiota bacterium]
MADADTNLTHALVRSPIETEQLIIEGTGVEPVEYPALPEVQGTRINSGKKTSFVKPEEFPSIANNDYREALATTPGLLVSEEPSSPIVNFGYRGLDSQRSEFMQVLKDGVSIKNEQFGFPESHYTPILDAVERIEFIRAGAALQFGPQPGGALNFVMKMPPRDVPFQFETKNLFGSDGLYQNFTSAGGTIGQFGYYAYFDHRERDGFRTNSAYDLNAGSVKLVYDATSDSRFILTLDAYDEEHGEPGGLTEVFEPGASLYQVDRDASTRLYDLFRLKRYYAMLEYQKVFSERTQLDIKAFGGYLQRYSQRQRGGGFGIAPNPNPAPGSAASTNDIQDREDYTQGVDVRFRHDYDLAHDTSTFTGGMYFYHALQDRHDYRGTTPNASSGLLRRFNTGETTDFALFAENRFHFGRLSIIPGMRLEFFEQSLDEHVNTTKPEGTLLSQSDFSFVPLFSLGAGYVLVEGQIQATTTTTTDKDGKSVANAPSMVAGGPPRLELYTTVAQSYRPRTYGELVSTAPDGVVNGDLKEGDSIQFELGLRGKPLSYLTFDVGGFYFEVTDQVGEITGVNAAGATFTTTQNVGDARYAGIEAAAELDLLGMINGGTESPYGRFNLYGNVTFLDAEFTGGPNEGFDTTYAPDYQLKLGGIYRWKEMVKAGLIGNMVGDSFADANNTKSHFIPAYTVWDLTAEVKFLDGRLGVFAGIKNLFDEDFYAEIRDEGIVPAYRRNYYGGFSVKF